MENNNAGVFAVEGANAGAAFQEYIIAFGLAAPLVDKDILRTAAANAFQVYYQHVLDLAFDKYGIPQEETEETGTACDACFCMYCAKFAACPKYPAADGITPPPCAECSKTGCTVPRVPDPLKATPFSNWPDVVCDEYKPAERDE